MKTYVLTVSQNFPTYHKCAGSETGFAVNILRGNKIHTIRENYKLWSERVANVNEGKAVIL